jgi:flagellar protein FliO/FliZ
MRLLSLLATMDEAIDSGAVPEAPPGDYGMMFMKMFLTLIGLVAFMGLTVWVLRKFISQRLQKKNGGQSIQILEKRMISQKTVLYLVEVDSQRVLISESQLEVRRLHEVVEKAPPRSE